MARLSVDVLEDDLASLFRRTRAPGGAIAVVKDEKVIFARGIGYRSLDDRLPMTVETAYPIGSTTKSMNAMLLAMLVDEGAVGWDKPVRRYLPKFFLFDETRSRVITVRDLVTMQTGLPRHDWVWYGSSVSREELISRLPCLGVVAAHREQFIYNNISTLIAGHIAEVVTGQTWEELIEARLLRPLRMESTVFGAPWQGERTSSYYEDLNSALHLTTRMPTEHAGPCGGSIHSTVEDMAKWVTFNLRGGRIDGRELLSTGGFSELWNPQVPIGNGMAGYSPSAAYGLGWVLDRYGDIFRVSHRGLIHNVHSAVMLFPSAGIGIVAFTNSSGPRLPQAMCEMAFDFITGTDTEWKFDALEEHRNNIARKRHRLEASVQVRDTTPTRRLCDYVGRYFHPGYGDIELLLEKDKLILLRGYIRLSLSHWHNDAWVAEDGDHFGAIHQHPFEASSLITFELSSEGEVLACLIPLEPAVAPIRFERQKEPE